MRLSPHDPNLGVFLAVLGACHLLLKHADQATDLLRRARAANPQYWYIHFWLAGALGFKGNLDEARQSVPPPSSGAFDCGKARGTESLQTPRWRGESRANQSLKWVFRGTGKLRSDSKTFMGWCRKRKGTIPARIGRNFGFCPSAGFPGDIFLRYLKRYFFMASAS